MITSSRRGRLALVTVMATGGVLVAPAASAFADTGAPPGAPAAAPSSAAPAAASGPAATPAAPSSSDPSAPSSGGGGAGPNGTTSPPSGSAAPSDPNPSSAPGAPSASGDPTVAPQVCDAACGQQLANITNAALRQMWGEILAELGHAYAAAASGSSGAPGAANTSSPAPAGQPTVDTATPAGTTTGQPAADTSTPAGTPAGGTTAAAGSLSADASAVFVGVNKARTDAGLAALADDPGLDKVAQAYAEQMAAEVDNGADPGKSGALKHTDPSGADPAARGKAAGVDVVAENIAEGTSLDPAGAVTGWLNSPGHKANMLNPDYTAVGTGVATSKSGVKFYAQDFGTAPSGTTPAQAPAPAPAAAPAAASAAAPAPAASATAAPAAQVAASN